MIIGAESVYTVTVTNGGDEAAEDVTVTDTLDPNVTAGALPAGCSASGQVVTCGGTGTALGPGETLTYEIPVTVNPDVSDGTNVTNRVTASSTTPGVADASTQLISQTRTLTDVRIEKSAPAAVGPNGTITYTVVVTNDGPSDAVDVTVEDPTNGNLDTIVSLPDECPASGLTITCPLGTLGPGDSVTLTIVVRANEGVTGDIINCATVYTGSRENNTGNNESCATTDVEPGPDGADTNVTVLKLGPATVNPDGTITYTIIVTDTGGDIAENVVIRDPDNPNVDIVQLPDECTDNGTEVVCDLGTMRPRDIRRLSITVHVHDDVADGTVLRNCASETTTSEETNHADDSSCVETVVEDDTPSPPPSPTDTPTPTPSPTDGGDGDGGGDGGGGGSDNGGGTPGGGGAGSGPSSTTADGNGLPSTGAAVTTLTLGAVALLVAGLILRRSASRRDPGE
ncbi:hypothetical protein [Spirillospora sp. NPDC047279]|uniref:hypothetical protein n=1 Tax=Spirillospora sp. NPDC047279 TaxID=3155478 RepID=UPI0034091D7B